MFWLQLVWLVIVLYSIFVIIAIPLLSPLRNFFPLPYLLILAPLIGLSLTVYLLVTAFMMHMPYTIVVFVLICCGIFGLLQVVYHGCKNWQSIVSSSLQYSGVVRKNKTILFICLGNILLVGILFCYLILPLLFHQQLTTSSLGNSDPGSYCLASKILTDPSYTHIPLAHVEDGRFGAYLLLSLISSLTGLACYQFFTVFQALLYLAFIVSMILLLHATTKSVSVHRLILIPLICGFHAFSMYFVFHGFFSQSLYLSLFPSILFFSVSALNKSRFFVFAAFIGGAAMLFYPESSIIILPFIGFSSFLLLRNLSLKNVQWTMFAGFMFILNPLLLFVWRTAYIRQFQTVLTAGWQMPRFPGLLELTGLYDMHLPLLPWYAIFFLSICVAFLLFTGLSAMANRGIWLFGLSLYVLPVILYLTTFNSYLYAKIAVILVPVLLCVLFSGLIKVIDTLYKLFLHRALRAVIVFIFLIIPICMSGYITRINVRVNHIVDSGFLEVASLQQQMAGQIVVYESNYPNYWDEIWLPYFMPKTDIYTRTSNDYFYSRTWMSNRIRVPVLFRVTSMPTNVHVIQWKGSEFALGTVQ